MKKIVVSFVAVVGLLAACAEEWNFLRGTPPGGMVRAGSVVTGEGLCALCATNGRQQAGFVLDRTLPLTGAFTIEAEVIVGRFGQPDCPPFNMLAPVWDDLGSRLEAPDTDNRGVRFMFRIWKSHWFPTLSLGYGDHIAECRGPDFYAKPGDRVRAKVHFSANRRIEWDIDGVRKTTYITDRGPALAGTKRPVIGDRAVSLQWPFTGAVRWVRVTSEPRPALELNVVSRRAFARDEKEARVELEAENCTDGEIRGINVGIRNEELGLKVVGDDPRTPRTIEAGGRMRFAFTFEPRVRTGWRPVEVTLSGTDAAGQPVSLVKTIEVGIAPLHAPRLPLVATDSGEDVDGPVALGLNECEYRRIYEPPMKDDPRRRPLYDLMDKAALRGLDLGVAIESQPAIPEGVDPKSLARVSRKGEVQTARELGKTLYVPETGDPRMLEKGYRVGRDWGAMLGSHPAFRRALIHGEKRDHSIPSFAGEAARYKAETGREVPPEVGERRIVNRSLAHSRYPDGIVPEDDPLFAYYRWFWKSGDGWPAYISRVSDGLKAGVGRGGFTTRWNPAVRCPPIWGSGGTVDLIDSWIYPTPEPMQVAGPAEELLAMAAGCPGQETFLALQMMYYRRQVAPKGEMPTVTPDWLTKFPLTEFVAIAPDAFLEGVWSMFAKPMKGYTFYPPECMIDCNTSDGYVFSRPELPKVFGDVMRGFAQPMGPLLLKLGRAEPDVAVFESFTSAVLGMPHGGGWMAPPITFLQRARLDPKVVYEETILRDGFGGIKVLYAPNCRFLTQKVIDRLKAFQRAGGILIADNNLNPQIKADISLRAISFDPPPEMDQPAFITDKTGTEGMAKARAATRAGRKAMQELTGVLREKLAGRYEGRSDSSSPEIVTYNRRWQDVDYLFAVNDHRTFGDYIGPWGRTMEKGLPMEGFVTMKDPQHAVKAVYELSHRKKVPFTREGDKVKVPVTYETCDGRLFAFLHQEIAAVKLACVRAGDRLEVTATVVDAAGKPVHALLPVEVRVFSSDGVELDGAGYLAAEDGVARISVLTNRDDPAGAYRVDCRDLLTGRKKTVSVR